MTQINTPPAEANTPSILDLDVEAQRLVFAAGQIQQANAAARQLAETYARLVVGINGLPPGQQFLQLGPNLPPIQPPPSALTLRQRYAAVGVRGKSGVELLTAMRALLVQADPTLDAALPPVAPAGYTLQIDEATGVVTPVAIPEAE
jgi:hypothetical protein